MSDDPEWQGHRPSPPVSYPDNAEQLRSEGYVSIIYRIGPDIACQRCSAEGRPLHDLIFMPRCVVNGKIETMGPQDWDQRMYQLADRDGITINCWFAHWSNMWDFADWRARVVK